MSTTFEPKNLDPVDSTDSEIDFNHAPRRFHHRKPQRIEKSEESMTQMIDEDDDWDELAATTVSPNNWPAFSQVSTITARNISSVVFSGKLYIAWIGGNSQALRVMSTTDGTTWPGPTNLFSGVDALQVDITVATLSGTTKLWMVYLDTNNKVWVSSSTNGTIWATPYQPVSTWSATSVSICGFQTSLYIAFTATSNNAVNIAYSSNGFITSSPSTPTSYIGDGVSLASFTFNGTTNLYLAYAGNTSPQQINIVISNGSTWPTTMGNTWYVLRNTSTTTPGQQWYASSGCLTLSSDANRMYLAFGQLYGTIYVASTMDPTQTIWSNATPIQNSSNTLSVTITPWTPSGSSNNVYLLRINFGNHTVQIAPYYLLTLTVQQVQTLLASTFNTANIYIAQVEDDIYLPLNGSILTYLYTNYKNINTSLNTIKCIPNSFATDSFVTDMKSIVSKYSYGNYPTTSAPNYLSYAGAVNNAYDYRWTSLAGLCGLIYAKNLSNPPGQQYRCFNFTVDNTIATPAIVCFDPQTGTTYAPSGGTVNGFTPYSILF